MSLINKMLQDLESRKNPQAEATQKKSVYEDLKPLSRVAPSRAPSRRLLMLLAAVAVVGAGAYGWTQWGDTLTASLFPDESIPRPAPVVARKPAPPKPAPVPIPVPAPAPVAAVVRATEIKTPLPPVATNEAPETTVIVTQAHVVAPVAVEQKKSETAPSPIVPAKVVPTKPKASAATEKNYWTVSRGETLYGIASKTGIDLWDLSSWNKLGREHVIHPGQRLRLTPPAAVSTKGTSGAQKSAPGAASAVASSARESQSGNAVLDKKFKALSADEKAESEYRRAVDLLQKGRTADAEKHLKSAMHASMTHTPTRELLAGVMLQQGHWREAQQILEEGIEKVPAHYPFAQLLARIYIEHGADQKALTVMETSRQAAADNPDYVAFLAAVYQRAGKHVEAVKTYNEAIALNPQEGRWWLGLGISLEAVQDWNAASTAYQRAINSGTLDNNLLKYARQRLTVVGNR